MKNKGFTLVELLAVIVLLGLIALVAVPAITGIIKSGKESLSGSQKESIIMSAKNWASERDNISKLPAVGTTNSVCVTLNTLQSSGYSDLVVKDPKTGDPMNVSVKITRDNKQIKYEIVDDSIGCSTYIS